MNLPAGMEDDDGSDDDGVMPIFGPNMEMLNFGNLNIAAHVGLNGNDDMFDDVMFDDVFFDDDDSFDDEMGYFMSDYDDDTDEGTSEASERQKKIFCTLQDSFVVLPRLRFHKENMPKHNESTQDKMCRLPRPVADKPESYESLHRLLEELELLIKVWRRRVKHPFTAHLQRRSEVLQRKPKDDGDEEHDNTFSSNGLHDRSKLFPGVDYTETDVESDVDSVCRNDINKSTASKSNEGLTKKKYCQSTRLYYDIFDTEIEVENLVILVKKCRKYIFHLVFSLFLDIFPSECSDRLPTELWEKIWRLTQTPFNHQEKDTFLAGARAAGYPKYLTVENERISDLFAAVGNLHMIVFEVLFKHPKIVTAPPVIDMESVGARSTHNMPYCKAIIQKYMKQLTVSFARLKELDKLDLKQKSIDYLKGLASTMCNAEVTVHFKESLETEENIDIKSENGVESEADGMEGCESSTGGTIVGKGEVEGTMNTNDDTESMTSAVSGLSLVRSGNKKPTTLADASSTKTDIMGTRNDVMYKIERGIYEVQPVRMDITELNLTDEDHNKRFRTADEICRDPIVLTTDEQTRYLAVLGYKQTEQNNVTNVYIVVWDVTTKKSVVRIETKSDILNIFASPHSKGLFCLSKNRFAFLHPIIENEPTTTAKFQKIRKIQREVCELHEWTWDPSDPPVPSSEEIHLNSSHGRRHIVDLLSAKKSDLDEKARKRLEDQKEKNATNGILNNSDDSNNSIGPIPELTLKTTTLGNGTVVHLIGQYVSDINHSSITMVDAGSGTIMDKIMFNGFNSRNTVLTQAFEVRGNRALLRRFNLGDTTAFDAFQGGASEIIFFDLDTRCEIVSYKALDLCKKPQSKCTHGEPNAPNDSKNAWLQSEKWCNYLAKFDVNVDRKQFLVYNQNLALYQLMQYDKDGVDSPQVLLIGSTYVYELTDRTFDSVVLSNGILFSAPLGECYPRIVSEYYTQYRDATALAVFAINIRDEPKATKCPIISIMEEKDGLDLAQMNECSRRIFWDKKDKRDANFGGISKFAQRFLHLVDDYTLSVSIGNATYLHIDMSLSGVEVAEREATQLYTAQLTREKDEEEIRKRESEIQKIEKGKEAARKMKDKERVELIQRLREKYVDKNGEEFTLHGKIHTWKKSYGFVRAKGEAKDLGNFFIHITDVKNKKKGYYPNRNKWIQFHAKYDPNQSSLRAADVMLIDKPLVGDTTDSPMSCQQNGHASTSLRIVSIPQSHAKGKGKGGIDQRKGSSQKRYNKSKKQNETNGGYSSTNKN